MASCTFIDLILDVRHFSFDLQPRCVVFSRVNPNGPADRAGCLNNDRVIEVNGINVQNYSHIQVATLIQFSLKKTNSKKYLQLGLIAQNDDQIIDE